MLHTLLPFTALEAKTREENAKAYDEWIVQKELRDSALKCLALVPRPVAEMPVLQDDIRGSATSLKKSASNALGELRVLKWRAFLLCVCCVAAVAFCGEQR